MSTRQIILLVTSREAQLKSFADALRADPKVELTTVDTAEASIETAARLVPVLAIIDQEVGEVSGMNIVQRLLEVNAFIHTAMLTEMDDALFHERSEGLGILSRVAFQPGQKDAVDLLAKLREVAPA
jgi:ActR/RegA family two-component response regulator